MTPWLRLEWRELWRAGPGAWLVPWLAGAAAATLLPPAAGVAALAALAAVLAVWTTARRLWRERHAGGLARLRLTPASTARVLLDRLAARVCILWLQVLLGPALVLGRRVSQPAAATGDATAVGDAVTASLWAGGPGLFALGALLLPPVLAVAAGVGAGAAAGLLVRRWRTLHLAAAALAAVLAATALLL